MTILAAVVVKSFVGKARLRTVLDDEERSTLTRRWAEQTGRAAEEAGAVVAVVTGDDEVAAWANERQWEALREPSTAKPGLNHAARHAADEAARRGLHWAIIHADLPLVAAADLDEIFVTASRTTTLAPAHDGGTNVVAGQGVDFEFSYGPGSFFRHLAAAGGDAAVVIRAGLALDVDTATDLAIAEALQVRRCGGAS